MQFYIYQLQREMLFSLLLLLFYLSSATPHSFCSLAFDTSPHVSVPPAQRWREVPETPDTIHSQKAICGKYISVVPRAVLLSFALWWSGWSYRELQTMVTDWAKLTTTLLSTVKLNRVA